jgi:Mat/Ecp fimbriae adhesin
MGGRHNLSRATDLRDSERILAMKNIARHFAIFFIIILNLDSALAVPKTVWPDAPIRNFLFIENQEDSNLFVGPTDGLDPRLTGSNVWTSLKHKGQSSLAYVDNGYNTAVTNRNIDMWENGPISRPYVNQRCLYNVAGCDAEASESINKPAVVDNKGFYGLIGAAYGWGHAKLSSNFFDYLRNAPVGSIIEREMNLCVTTVRYDAIAGGRCADQSSGNWYVRKIRHKKAGHLRFIQTNSVSEVIVDSNGNPFILPGSQGCENYRIGTLDGIVCRFLDYSFNEDGSQTYTEPYMYTNVKHGGLNSAIAAADLQMSANMNTWVNKGVRYNVSNLRGRNSIYIFMSSNFFRQIVRLGLQEQLTRNLVSFEMKNGFSPESGYYEFSGTTEIKIKPRQFSVSILSSDGITNPYREGSVGKDILRFFYNIYDSGPSSADILDISISQDAGSPYQGYCTFHPLSQITPDKAVPVPTKLIFDSTQYGSSSSHPIRCDNTPLDIRSLGIQDSQPPQEWLDPNGDKGITRFYSLALEFDLTDPMVQQTITNRIWEGEVHQSGTITIKGTWR